MKKIILFIAFTLLPLQLIANEEAIKKIEREISFLAKKLIDVSGQSTYTIEKTGKSQTFIGGCFEVMKNGVKVTCITPGLDLQKKKMNSGNIIIKINNVSFLNNDIKRNDFLFSQVTKDIKPNDILKFTYQDQQQIKEVDIVISEIVYPSFKFTVSKPIAKP